MTATGPWIQTYSGIAMHPFSPSPDEINLRDIAQALGQVCRYGGHSRFFYSVAEHSVILSRLAPPDLALWALLHDAAEAYMGDIMRPIKLAIQHDLPELIEFEASILQAIASRFGLPWPMPAGIKRFDLALLAAEAPQVMLHPPQGWHLPVPPLLGVVVNFWPPDVAVRNFLLRAAELGLDWSAANPRPAMAAEPKPCEDSSCSIT